MEVGVDGIKWIVGIHGEGGLQAVNHSEVPPVSPSDSTLAAGRQRVVFRAFASCSSSFVIEVQDDAAATQLDAFKKQFASLFDSASLVQKAALSEPQTTAAIIIRPVSLFCSFAVSEVTDTIAWCISKSVYIDLKNCTDQARGQASFTKDVGTNRLGVRNPCPMSHNVGTTT